MSQSANLVIEHIEHATQVYKDAEASGKLPALAALKEWQCDRLLASHYHLWEVERFQPAITFFINELYGPKDFTERDADIAKVVPKMEKWLPERAFHSLEVAIHLNTLSQDLDLALLDQLGSLLGIIPSQKGTLNAAAYAQAYKACNNPRERALQLDYIEKLGADLAKVVKIPGISSILKMARTPAKTIGVESLQQFLEDGFSAFKKLGKVEDFMVPIITEERRISEALFRGEDVLPPL
ncbi:FFLEELY motif protein [Alteromonas sp. a30]|uniref:FFLEELY motif protein n=1 Tax=Alteromonas sp. a30 TaxID=2730917 RepID=UPI00227DAA5A|nr:hypothetical protein [Alteromonas sp. a30]MCY7296575.1 hypothetical protein [Alteromonas sp. a30]